MAKNRPGQVIVLSLVFMGIVLVAAVSVLNYEGVFITQTKSGYERERALALAEAGINKAIRELNQTAGAYSGETFSFGGGEVVTRVTTIDSLNKNLEATAYIPNAASPKAQRKVTLKVSAEPPTDALAFHYGVQVGDGGLTMGSGAEVEGSIYSNGSISGAGANHSTIEGDAFIAGANIIDGVKITGQARANTILDSEVGGDAYFQVLTDTEVDGAEHPGSPDLGLEPFPISPGNVADWKLAAEAGGTIEGDYEPNLGETTLGPKKITGNLVLDNHQSLILTGTVWVQGYIDVSNGASVRLHPDYGRNSGTILADKWVQIGNNGVFNGSGDEDSFLLMVSLANCRGGTQTDDCASNNSAIILHNNVDSTIFYAPNGLIHLNNLVHVKEAAGYMMHLSNNTEVDYESGLANAQFSNGPSGAWAAVRGTWQESR